MSKFLIKYTDGALKALKELEAYDRSRILDKIDEQLLY